MKYRTPEYPRTEKKPVADTLHGRVVIDPYQWLENSEDPNTQLWVEAQENITHSILDRLPQRAWLIKRFSEIWRYDDERTPRKVLSGSRLFFWTIKKDWDRWAYYYRETDFSPAVLLLNPNEWGLKTLSFVRPSRDGKYIAYGIAEAGNEQTIIKIMDVTSRKVLSDSLYGWRQRNVAWLPDNSGFYYSTHPLKGEVPEGEENYWSSVYFHKLETSGTEDTRVFSHDQRKEYYHAAEISEDGQYLLLYRASFNRNEVYLKSVTDDEIKPLITNFDARYYVDIIEGKIIIWTDSLAPKGMVYITDIKRPERKYWKILIPETDDNLLYISPIAGHLLAVYSRKAYTTIKVYSIEGEFLKDIPLPTLGSASIWGYWSMPDVWIQFSSFTFPRTTFKYDILTDELILYHKPPIEIDVTNYLTEQVWYESKDKTKISMFLIRHKNTVKDSRNAVYLTGYGGFNVSMDPYFSTAYTLWLEAGGMVAIPNLRGGGEYGREWHEAGMLENKQNVFDDFIAAAEWLMMNRYTTRDKLVIGGASNGGLLVSAVAVQRPDLFKAVYCAVPLTDMLRYHKFGYANIWAEEYGSADDPLQFDYLVKYSPYHNIVNGTPYPTMLFVGSENDARCHPFHAMKMVARLQEADPDGPPILLLVRKKSGHDGGTTITELIEQYAEVWSYLMAQVGLMP